jgi:hypothetical protein
MKKTMAAAIAGALVVPAFAQEAATVTCAEFVGLDEASQVLMIEEINSLLSLEGIQEPEQLAGDLPAASPLGAVRNRLIQDCTIGAELVVPDLVRQYYVEG